MTSGGCAAPWFNKKADAEVAKAEVDIAAVLAGDQKPQLVGDAARLDGLRPQQFEAFALVTQLPGTGGDIKPGPQRDYILREMRVREVGNPNALLASASTAVVKLRVNVPPGVQAGDRLDVIVERSSDCEATSVRNGWLMPSRLLELVALEGQIRESDLKGTAEGRLVSMPASLNSTKQIDPDLAVVLGGARVNDEQAAYLRLDESVRHGETIKRVVATLNTRFDVYHRGELKGIAEGKSDRTIALLIPADYRHDLQHFADVILSVGFMEDQTQLAHRMEKAGKALLDPVPSQSAAHQLEAIGKDALPLLAAGLDSPNASVRFNAAYALAFLDDPRAVPTLAELAARDPQRRQLALIGLTVIESREAEEALRQLLQEPEVEVCYGALHALRRRSSYEPSIRGLQLPNIGRLTELQNPQPCVAVALQQEPEVVIFGGPIGVRIEDYYEVNPRMMMTNTGGMIRLSHFQPGQEDLFATAEPNLQSLLHAMSSVKATYSDVVQFLDAANAGGWLSAPVKFNPLPSKPGDTRVEAGTETQPEEDKKLSRGDLPQDKSTIPPPPVWDLRRYF